MKIFNFTLGALLFVGTAFLLVSGGIALQLRVYYPKVVAFFSKRREFVFRKREPIGFSY